MNDPSNITPCPGHSGTRTMSHIQSYVLSEVYMMKIPYHSVVKASRVTSIL
jgi:hypothetical protein